ncbi:hypothetical protein D3C75_775470 [compost metagenome]
MVVYFTDNSLHFWCNRIPWPDLLSHSRMTFKIRVCHESEITQDYSAVIHENVIEFNVSM